MYDRSRVNGGFISGPSHGMMGLSGQGKTMPPTEAPTAPNYRESDSSGQDCMSCRNLNLDNGQCSKYGFKPKLYFVCDSFEDEGDSGEENPPEQQLTADSEAEQPGPAR